MAGSTTLPWPTPNLLPKSIRRNANHFYGLSTKSNPPGRKVDLFGALEYHNWLLTETDGQVDAFCEQPLKLTGRNKGRNITYIMDAWWRTRDGRECYREIKEFEELVERPDGTRVPQKWDLAEEFARKNRCAIDFVTENELHANPIRLRNAERCVGYAWTSFRRQDKYLRDCISVLVEEQESTSLRALCKLCSTDDPEAVLAAACYLVVHGTLNSDLNTKLFSLDTEVSHGLPSAA